MILTIVATVSERHAPPSHANTQVKKIGYLLIWRSARSAHWYLSIYIQSWIGVNIFLYLLLILVVYSLFNHKFLFVTSIELDLQEDFSITTWLNR